MKKIIDNKKSGWTTVSIRVISDNNFIHNIPLGPESLVYIQTQEQEKSAEPINHEDDDYKRSDYYL